MKGVEIAGLLGLFLLVGGCASYYELTDPITKKVYYATDYDSMSGGSVEFEDAGSGALVVLQNSEIKEISEEEFYLGRFATQKPAN